MGVFSYLNIKKPASIIWKALSPGRDIENTSETSSEVSGNVAGEEVIIKRGFCSPNIERHLISIGQLKIISHFTLKALYQKKCCTCLCSCGGFFCKEFWLKWLWKYCYQHKKLFVWNVSEIFEVQLPVHRNTVTLWAESWCVFMTSEMLMILHVTKFFCSRFIFIMQIQIFAC